MACSICTHNLSTRFTLRSQPLGPSFLTFRRWIVSPSAPHVGMGMDDGNVDQSPLVNLSLMSSCSAITISSVHDSRGANPGDLNPNQNSKFRSCGGTSLQELKAGNQYPAPRQARFPASPHKMSVPRPWQGTAR